MSEIRSVKCDCCGKELVVDSKYPANWGVHLSAHNYGINTSGLQYAIAMSPPLKAPLDFCGLKCLAEWINNRNNPGASQ